MRLLIKKYQIFFDLLWRMTEKEVRVRYKYTLFGLAWLAVNPLLQMAIIGFVFSFLLKEPVEHFYLRLLAGLLLWNFFSMSLIRVTSSIVYEGQLIKKAVFPRSTIPLSIILSNFIHFSVATSLLILFISLFGIADYLRFFLLIPLMVWILSFTIGISLLTSSLNVRFRDVAFFVQAALLLWFYATPIIYPMSLIPEAYRWLWDLNPLTAPMQLFQSILIGTPAAPHPVILFNLLLSILICGLGIAVFRRESRNFADWI